MSNAYRWLVTFAIGFYSTFVLQNLWNWFAVPAMRVPPISYWLMLGLNMLVQAVRGDSDSFPMLTQHASLSDEEKRRVEEQLTNERLWTEVILPTAFSKLVGLTVTLAMGWLVQTFLV